MKSILKNIIFIEYLGFIFMTLVLWLNEIFDIPHYLLGFKKTPINWPESILESFLIIILATVIITLTKNLLKKIEDIAMRDPLTGLLNRRYMYEYFQYIKSTNSKRFFSFILCDLDHFKKINDNFGHDCGDYVLKKTAEIIKNKIRPGDLAGRWGGEEFLIILPGLEIYSAFDVAERIRKEIFNYDFNWGSDNFKISMSFGLSGSSLNDNHPCDIITCADERLYEAKNSGRNKVVY
ncbi:MAG: GGDEF domain-containing protein [Desulfobacteraceae bacterium]|nr:GGDEF domain-containing protein [Desulfobacteraceae bacterium]